MSIRYQNALKDNVLTVVVKVGFVPTNDLHFSDNIYDYVTFLH